MRERAERHPTDAAIRVWHEDDGRRADAINISESGACLSGVGRLPPDAPVTVQYLHLCIRARVAWSSPKVTGVRFTAPLKRGELECLRLAMGEDLGGSEDDE